jgi:predicted NBD/HSP70 family sugar kinase
LANLITLFAPQRIALTGGMMKSAPFFWDDLRNETRARCHLLPFETTQLVQGQLGANAGLIGAAAIFFSRP